MRLPREFFIIGGSALVLAAVLLGGIAFNPRMGDTAVFATGDSTPTVDPCEIPDSVASFNGVDQIADLTALQAPPDCPTPTEETLPKTHTPTPRPTEEPTDEPEDTPVPATNTPSPATNTPTGGAGGEGLRPPNTGTGGSERSTAMQWLLVGTLLALAAGGVSSLAYGIRRR